MNNLKSSCSELNIVKKRIMKILLKESKNQECFECSSLYPEYISLNNGIFICKKCVKNHLKLPNNYSNIIKNNLNNLNLKDIQYLSCGGNRKLKEFINIEYPDLKKYSPIYFYQTFAMDYYRKYLKYLIEGGLKPIKPFSDVAYELIPDSNNNYNLNNNGNEAIMDDNHLIRGKKNLRIKTDSFVKINKHDIIYPKIKPIIGTKNEFKFSQGLNKFNNFDNNYDLGYNNKDLYLTSSNFNNLNYLNNTFKDVPQSGKLSSSSSTDLKYRYHSHYYNNSNNYDVDYDEINDIINNNKEINEQINDLSDINEINEIKDLNKISIKINKDNSKLKSRIVKRNKVDPNLNVFKLNNNSINNNNINYFSTKSSYPNQLNSFQNSNNNRDNKKYYKNSVRNKNLFIDINNNKNNIKNKKDGNCKQIISSIEDLRNYLNNPKEKHKESFVFNLNIDPNKAILTENSNSTTFVKGQREKRALNNNINNNIIINKNLNLFYNNNKNLHRIFKKKNIRNSFSINEKSQNLPKFNYSLEKIKNFSSFVEPCEVEKIYKIKKKIKNEWKRKVANKIAEKNKENNFIKVNKINNQLKLNGNKNNNKIINDICNFDNDINNNNNSTCGNIFLNYKNNNVNYKNNKNLKYIINNTFEEKAKIAQRISNVITINKNNNEIMNQGNIIRVKQKEKNIQKNSRNITDDMKFNYIGVITLQQKREQKEKEKNKNDVNKNVIPNIGNIEKRKIRIAKSYNNILDRKRRSLLLMKDLINLPFGKKRSILEIVKTNNLSSKSVSPSSKKLLQHFTDPNY